jgi:hypothetical protein
MATSLIADSVPGANSADATCQFENAAKKMAIFARKASSPPDAHGSCPVQNRPDACDFARSHFSARFHTRANKRF